MKMSDKLSEKEKNLQPIFCVEGLVEQVPPSLFRISFSVFSTSGPFLRQMEAISESLNPLASMRLSSDHSRGNLPILHRETKHPRKDPGGLFGPVTVRSAKVFPRGLLFLDGPEPFPFVPFSIRSSRNGRGIPGPGSEHRRLF